MKRIGQTAAVQKDRYKIKQGEPGQGLVTPFEGGQPTSEKPPLALASPASSSVPAVIPKESKTTILSRQDEIVHYWYDLIAAIEGAISSQKQLKKGTVINQCLTGYNSGIFLKEIYKKLGHIKRSSFYKHQKAFKEGGIEALAAPQRGRKGESKITDDEKNCLLTILRHQNRIKIGSAICLMKYAFALKGIPSPSSARTLRRYIDQFGKEHYDYWILCREGEKSLNDRVLPYIQRDRNLLEVGGGLVADGHRLNFDIINPFTGKPCRAVMVLFLDWRSSYPLGWEIMLEENVQCIASALRNAILTLGKTPKWLLIDNGKAFKAKIFNSSVDFGEAGIEGMFLRLDIQTHFSQPYNAQAKIAERWWRIFTDWFERLMPSFRGSSIEDKPAYLKRNERLARSAHDPWIPTIREVNDQLYELREFYVDQPSKGLDGKTPREIFEQGKGPGVNATEIAYLMMPMKITNITRNGINLFGCYWYDEALYGLKDQVVIKYSLSDLSQIYCFYKNEFLCTLKPRQKAHPMASESGTPKDMEDVKRMIAQKKSLKNQTVKLYRLLGKKQEQLPWKEIIQEAPNVIEAIEKEEAKKPKEKIISPFIDGVTYGDESERRKPEFISPFVDEPEINTESLEDGTTSQRPSWKHDFEKYDWLMEQDILTPNDRKWIDEHRASASLLKYKVFNDQEELDRKVMFCEGLKGHKKFKPPRDWSGFYEYWERFDYHMGQDPATLTTADVEFIDWYRNTSEYKAIYEGRSDRILSGG